MLDLSRSPPPSAGPLPPATLLRAVRRLLRPLARLLMENGLTFPILADILRDLFVDVAANDILKDPKTRTDSRISLLSGVHRKEIKRWREAPAEVDSVPPVVTIASQVVARWLGSAAFLQPDGTPRPLPRVAAGGESGFDALVGSLTTDIRPRALLDDLLAHGIVFIDEADRVRLDGAAFVPRPGGEEQLYYFGRNLHDHVAAAVANISATAIAPFIERAVHYDGLTEAQASALEEYARAAAINVLLEVNRKALELTAGDPEPMASAMATRRVNLGVYLFHADDPPAQGVTR